MSNFSQTSQRRDGRGCPNVLGEGTNELNLPVVDDKPTMNNGCGLTESNQRQEELKHRAERIKEINERAWYERVAEPLVRIAVQSPEIIRQQVAIVYGGYRELAKGMLEYLQDESSKSENILTQIKNAYLKGIVRAGNYIEDYRMLCESRKHINSIGSVLGDTTEFGRGNSISDLITLHPITAYANPVMEVVDAAYDEALLSTTNELSKCFGASEEDLLTYIDLKKLQNTDINFITGQRLLNIAKISGSLALSPGITADTLRTNLFNNFKFSGLIATGTQLKDLSLPKSLEEIKNKDIISGSLEILDNTFSNMANSIGMASVSHLGQRGYFKLKGLKVPSTNCLTSSSVLKDPSGIRARQALMRFQTANQMYQTVDDLCDFLESGKDTALNLDVHNPLSIFGHMLVIGATTKDLMGDGPNDDRYNNVGLELVSGPNSKQDVRAPIGVDEISEILEEKHEVESIGYNLDINNSIEVDLGSRIVATAYYSNNKQVLYFNTGEEVAAYRRKRVFELGQESQSPQEKRQQEEESIPAFYDEQADVIVAISPVSKNFTQVADNMSLDNNEPEVVDEDALIIQRSFLVHEIAHKKGFSTLFEGNIFRGEYLAYIAQAQYLSEYGFQMQFYESDYKIEKSDSFPDSVPELPDYNDIINFVRSKSIYQDRRYEPRVGKLSTDILTLPAALEPDKGKKHPYNFTHFDPEHLVDEAKLATIEEVVRAAVYDGEIGCVYGTIAERKGEMLYMPVRSDFMAEDINHGFSLLAADSSKKMLCLIPQEQTDNYNKNSFLAWKMYREFLFASIRHAIASYREQVKYKIVENSKRPSILLCSEFLRDYESKYQAIVDLLLMRPEYAEYILKYSLSEGYVGLTPVLFDNQTESATALVVTGMSPCYKNYRVGENFNPRYSPYFALFCGKLSDVKEVMIPGERRFDNTVAWYTSTSPKPDYAHTVLPSFQVEKSANDAELDLMRIMKNPDFHLAPSIDELLELYADYKFHYTRNPR
ncbi:MAG: hypothetical protein KBC84_08505 [Proteobacteria bacterium]|nr:hypothetical protein [Pseudomonadota bacterium]